MTKETTGATILEEMAQTYRQRNVVYGDNFRKVGPVMKELFPNGILLNTPEDFTKFHILDWIVGKLTRFASTGMLHVDSIHDIGVYSAMLELLLREMENEKQK